MNRKNKNVGIKDIDYVSLLTNDRLRISSSSFYYAIAISEGLPIERLYALKDSVGWTVKEITQAINFSVKKADRCKKLAINLDIDKTESLVDLAMFLSILSSLKIDDSAFINKWLFHSNKDCQGRTPFEFLNTKSGRRFVLGLYRGRQWPSNFY